MASLCVSSASSSPIQSARNLHAFLVSCTNNVGEACRAVDAFLKEQPPEAAIGFFRLCFPLLLQKVFGFQDSASSSSSSSWLARTTDEQSATALRSLLDPSSNLFSSLLALDREKAVEFIFPNERLPGRIRRLLLLDRGATLVSQTSELLKNRMKISSVGGLQLQLNLFEYYFFWFAYYAASCEEFAPTQAIPALTHNLISPGRSIRHWVPTLHTVSHHNSTKSAASHHGLYLQLLHAYLTQFVQLHHYSGMIYIPGTNCLSQGGFLLLTLLEFWLMKDDPWPLQGSQLGIGNMGFTHSAVELDAVRSVINHCNRLKISCNTYTEAYDDAHYTIPGSRSFLGSPLASPLTWHMGTSKGYVLNADLLQKPLYRFLSRAFLYWPAGISVKQAWYLVEIWIDYMQPWKIDIGEKQAEKFSDTSKFLGKEFSVVWQGHVTRNYYYYTMMVVHFLNFALKYVRANLEPILDMTAKVLGVLVSSKELLDLLRKIELSTGSVPGKVETDHSLFEDMDWEENAPNRKSQFGYVFSPIAEETARNCGLFAPGEGGAFYLFQMLILQCEAEIQLLAPESQKSVSKSLDLVKHAGLDIFQPYLLCNSIGNIHFETERMTPFRNEAKALGRHTCFDVKYRGDWMRRPIESTEVAFLVRFFVKLSDIINYRLKLEGQDDGQSTKMHDYDRFPHEEVNVSELLTKSKHTVVTLSIFDIPKELKGFLLSCCAALRNQLRRHGWRVNLRFLAQKHIVVLIVVVLVWLLKKLSDSLPLSKSC
ncbi:hypothetical protein KP509_39G036000 [Ceratopteris richardii]|uniref:Uncharacterized protein n=1 Tax=Ceratopteris richardii TaxID=49495 RepID=A0A8T2PZY3_CERRI|nr:hypothetical protein KP509_39G036000 [Ceratopteris richardii]